MGGAEAVERIKRLETLLGELCAVIAGHEFDRLTTDWGQTSLREEADRIQRELAVNHPGSCA